MVLNIGHVNQFIELCQAEKSIRDDGLIHRFLICAPAPVFLTAEAMSSAPDSACSLTILLNFIFKVHMGVAEERKIYKLSEDAEFIFNQYFNVNRKQVQDVNRSRYSDLFIG